MARLKPDSIATPTSTMSIFFLFSYPRRCLLAASNEYQRILLIIEQSIVPLSPPPVISPVLPTFIINEPALGPSLVNRTDRHKDVIRFTDPRPGTPIAEHPYGTRTLRLWSRRSGRR